MESKLTAKLHEIANRIAENQFYSDAEREEPLEMYEDWDSDDLYSECEDLAEAIYRGMVEALAEGGVKHV